MTTNEFFSHYNYTPTQDLIEDLVIENIQMYGIDMQYLPRTLNDLDELYDEDRESIFNNAVNLEFYPNTVQQFGGQGDFISQFGFEIKDNFELTVSKKRFNEETGSVRPNEGDLIYFPLSKTFFQIDFVEDENPFFQAGRLYVYVLTCSTFDFSSETFDTGNEEIDKIAIDYENINDINNDLYADNDIIDEEGDSYMEFSVTNPFGSAE